MNKVLVVAFHFPPMTHSSGVQRTLRFVRYLRNAGWESLVLSANPRAYVSVGDEQVSEIPADMLVERAFALDAARHLAVAGRYPGYLANPDRWASWRPFAVRIGRQMIRKHRPSAIFSTYPIASAHSIGGNLACWSGLPWVADFRDSMMDSEYPSDLRLRGIHQELEHQTVERCSRAIFTTESARQMYRARYPDLPEDRWAVIPNGYDEPDFSCLAVSDPRVDRGRVRRCVLLHSGVLYPVERDPMPFFRTLADLKRRRVIDSASLLIRLRATAHDDYFLPRIIELGLGDIVELADPLPYSEALSEMMHVDGLLLFQAEGCNHQVPAKLYEYMRARKPIIALTHSGGDTAEVLREASADNILPLDDQALLTRRLPAVLEDLNAGSLNIAPMEIVTGYSREQRAMELAGILNEAAFQPG